MSQAFAESGASFTAWPEDPAASRYSLISYIACPPRACQNRAQVGSILIAWSKHSIAPPRWSRRR